MRAEDLFAAIGELEESRLERSELSLTSPENPKEEPNMKHKSTRTVRNLLIAAIIVTSLAITALAATGLLFNSPVEMLDTVMGENGYAHVEPSTVYEEKLGEISTYVSPGYDKAPLDEALAENEIAPLVNPVGQSISADGITVTVDSFLYDNTTRCGLVTYSVENPAGLPKLETTENGETMGSNFTLAEFNCYGRNYLIPEKTTDTRYAMTYFFHADRYDGEDLIIFLDSSTDPHDDEKWALQEQLKQELRQQYTQEEIIEKITELWGGEEAIQDQFGYRMEDLPNAAYSIFADMEYMDRYVSQKIVIPLPENSNLTNTTFDGGNITLTNLCILFDRSISPRSSAGPEEVTIHFSDGSEYVVYDEYNHNTMFDKYSDGVGAVHMFNRIIDVNDVASIELDNGVAYTKD